MSFDELRLPADAVLGEIGKGFRYAQVRLAPARLSHCMRWLGSANRAQDIATDYARTREAFGKKLGEHEGVWFMLADNAMDIHLARLSIWHTAWVLDQGHRASNESSMSKVICSEAIARVADRSLQILGGMGITRDTVVERIFRDTRAFRIYDGPSEVHRWALGARIVGGKMWRPQCLPVGVPRRRDAARRGRANPSRDLPTHPPLISAPPHTAAGGHELCSHSAQQTQEVNFVYGNPSSAG